jgi:hypothetical protein
MWECKRIFEREEKFYRSTYRQGAKFALDWHCSFIIRKKKIREMYLIMHTKLVESDLFEEKRFYKKISVYLNTTNIHLHFTDSFTCACKIVCHTKKNIC